METVVIPQKEYRRIIDRQMRIEKDLRVVKTMLQHEISDGEIRPEVLRRWEKISRDLDRGKGHAFSSASDMRRWLKRL